MDTCRHNIRTEDFIEELNSDSNEDARSDVYIRAVYVRSQSDSWHFLLGRVSWGSKDESEVEEYYRDYAFVAQRVSGHTGKSFLEALTDRGYRIRKNFPALTLREDGAYWRQELVPSDTTGTGFPARRFSIRIEKEAPFIGGPLVGYGEPFHRSAAVRIRRFMSLPEFHGDSDARKGELFIEIPDKRAAICFEGNRLSIRQSRPNICIVGQIDEQEPILLVGNESTTVETDEIRDIELWLVSHENEILDYRSSSAWPYRYETSGASKEHAKKLLDIIRQGESETCEFKPFIDLYDENKAPEIERTVCALSNLSGGMLFIGVTDEGEVAGITKGLWKSKHQGRDDARDVYVNHVRRRLRESLKDNQCFSAEAVCLYSMSVVVVSVDRSQEVNFLLKSNQAYIRRGATSAKMAPNEIIGHHKTRLPWNGYG